MTYFSPPHDDEQQSMLLTLAEIPLGPTMGAEAELEGAPKSGLGIALSCCWQTQFRKALHGNLT